MISLNIKIPSPFTSLFIGFCFVFFLIIIAPVEYNYLGSLYSWIYTILSLIFIFLGMLFGSKFISLKNRNAVVDFRLNDVLYNFKLLVLISIFGVLLRVIDRFFIRGVSLSTNVFENREALESGTNIIAVISSFLYPMVFLIPFYFLLISKCYKINVIKKIILIFISLYPIFDGLLFGSRSIILSFIALIFLYSYILGFISIKIKGCIYFSLFVLAMLTISGFLFDERTSLMGMSAIDSTRISVYAYFTPLNESFSYYLKSLNNGFFYYLLLGTLNFIQYMIHGLFEMLFLVDTFNTDNIYWGAQNLSFIFKFMSSVFGFDSSIIHLDFMVRKGAYNTLLGPAYYDFGFFGVLFLFFIGYIGGCLYRKSLKGNNINIIPLYTYLIIIVFFVLIVNMITFAQGLYYIVSFFIFYIVTKLKLGMFINNGK